MKIMSNTLRNQEDTAIWKKLILFYLQGITDLINISQKDQTIYLFKVL